MLLTGSVGLLLDLTKASESICEFNEDVLKAGDCRLVVFTFSCSSSSCSLMVFFCWFTDLMFPTALIAESARVIVENDIQCCLESGG